MIYPETTFDAKVDESLDALDRRKKNVNDYILDLLKSGWTSAADAFRELGTMKLPTRVSDFRKQGIKIEQRTVRTVNRFGKTIYHNEYRIQEERQ